jgi:hypothetical protein
MEVELLMFQRQSSAVESAVDEEAEEVVVVADSRAQPVLENGHFGSDSH